VSGLPRHLQRYYISQFLPTSTRQDVYPMRALHLAAVQLQRVARGRGVRTRLGRVDWALLGGGDATGRVERHVTAMRLARPPPLSLRAAAAHQPPGGARRVGLLSKYLALVAAREASGQELRPYEGCGYMVWCAARVAAWWRMARAKWFYTTLRFRPYHIASQQIQ
jgi:hypothetical protein